MTDASASSGHRRRTFWRVVGLARPAVGRLALALVATLGAVAAGIGVPLLTKVAIDDGIREAQHGVLAAAAAGVLGLSLARAAANFLRRNLAGRAGIQIEWEVRNRLFAHLQGLPISFHDRWQAGQLLARATSDLNNIRMFVGFALIFLALIVATLVTVLVVIARLDLTLALITLLFVPAFALLALRFNYELAVIARDVQDRVGDVAGVVEESAAGVRVVKAFGREREEIRKLEAAASRLLDSNLRAVRRRALFLPFLQLLPPLNVALVLLVGGRHVADGTLTIGGLVAINTFLAMLVWPLRHAGWIFVLGQRAIASGERVFEILDTMPEIRDRPGARAPDRLEGAIRFEGVWFRYGDAARAHEVERGSDGERSRAGEAPLDGPRSDDRGWVLRDVSLEVEPGEVVALVGATASGKSTLAALVPRFHDATRGEVLVGGHDVRDLRIRALRTAIGVVFDEPILFSASVRENIALGRPDARDDEIEQAARAAGAHEFVLELPLGYDTVIGEQGFSLSGGQRQRIALARALLLKPRILILDDPLSSVDLHTEAAIEDALQVALAGRTTLLVARRPSTVALADRVVYLENGRIAAVGTHAELMRTSAGYRAVLAQDLAAVDVVADRPEAVGGAR